MNYIIVDTTENTGRMYIGEGGENCSLEENAMVFATEKEAIEKIAEGRVWTGETAKGLGLEDVLGGIDTALNIAVSKAGVENYTVISYPEKEDLFSMLFNSKPTNYIESQLLQSKLGEYYQQFNLIKSLNEKSMIQVRIPFELNIK